MFIVVRVYFILIILNILKENDALVELPQVEDNDILNTESIIRSTINKLFSSIKLKGVRENPKLKQYGLIHNYFVSLTLKDYNNLKEIARLTRVDKKTIDNTSIKFIDLINEILNGDIGFEGVISSFNFNNEIGNYIDGHSQNVAYLKQTYGDNSPRTEINKEILRILENDYRYLNKTTHRKQNNDTSVDHNVLLDENDFWVPDLGFRRIFQGKRTKIKYFPFMTSVQFFNNFQCGGSIISDDLVITAASCLQLVWNNRLFRENPSFLSVRIGSNYYEGGGEMIAVLEVYFYPTYNPQNLRNNIALMRLVRKINFRGKKIARVKKIDIDRKESALPYNINSITIVGWGAKKQSNIISSPWDNKISFAELDMYPLKDCQDTYSTEYVTQKNFCAGKLSVGSGACNKDVGGPGIVHGVLTGVVSFGSPVCGTPDAPTVFTKVGFYADWIEEIMEQANHFPHGKKLLTSSTRYTFYIPPSTTAVKMINLARQTMSTTAATTKQKEEIIETTEKSQYNRSILYPTPMRNKEESITEQDSVLFKQFLKTMFSSKELDQYLDTDDSKVSNYNAELVDKQQYLDANIEKSMNNAEEIETKSNELEESSIHMKYIPKGITQLLSIKQFDASEEFTNTPTERDVLFTSLERVTKLDESMVYKPDKINSNIKLKKGSKVISKEDSEVQISSEEENNEEIVTSKEEDKVNNLDSKIEEEDIVRILDEIDREEKDNWQKDKSTFIKDISKSNEFEARKDTDKTLLKMVDNIDLQEKNASLWQKDKIKDTKKSENEDRLKTNESLWNKDNNVDKKLDIDMDKVDLHDKIAAPSKKEKRKNNKLDKDNIDQPKKILPQSKKDKNKVKKKVDKKLPPSKKNKKHQNLDKDLDKDIENSLLTFLYFSDSDKKSANLTAATHNNESITDYSEEKIESDASGDSDDDDDKIMLDKSDEETVNALEIPLQLNNKIHELNVTSTSKMPYIMDLTFRKHKNEGVYNEKLSKKILFDVLSEVIDYNKNKNVTDKT